MGACWLRLVAPTVHQIRDSRSVLVLRDIPQFRRNRLEYLAQKKGPEREGLAEIEVESGIARDETLSGPNVLESGVELQEGESAPALSYGRIQLIPIRGLRRLIEARKVGDVLDDRNSSQ